MTRGVPLKNGKQTMESFDLTISHDKTTGQFSVALDGHVFGRWPTWREAVAFVAVLMENLENV